MYIYTVYIKIYRYTDIHPYSYGMKLAASPARRGRNGISRYINMGLKSILSHHNVAAREFYFRCVGFALRGSSQITCRF